MTATAAKIIDEPTARDDHRSRRARRIVLALVIAGGLALLVWLLCAISVQLVPGNSDGATVVLEGNAIAHGNVTLSGWIGGYDAFWTLDALLYAIAVGLGGIHPIFVNLVPAVLAAAVVVAGAWIALSGRTRRAALIGGAVLAAVLIFPTTFLSIFFLQGPLHVETVLVCLCAFALLAPGRSTWRVVLAVALLAMGLLGDLQALAFGVIPVALAGLVAMRRARAWRAGVVQLGAALLSILVALAGRGLAIAAGTFTTGASNPVATNPQMRKNLRLGVSDVVKLFGVHTVDLPAHGVPTGLEVARAVPLAIGVAAIAGAAIALVVGLAAGSSAEPVAGLARLGRAMRARRGEGAVGPRAVGPRAVGQRAAALADACLDDMLVIAAVAAFGVFVRYAAFVNINFARYLTAAVVFTVVLGARLAARAAERVTRAGARRLVALVAICALAGCASATGFVLSQTTPTRSAAQVAGFLRAHHLTEGLGDYWSAAITTVQARGTVVVRPLAPSVAPESTRLISPYAHGDTAWFGKNEPFNFFIYNTRHIWSDVDARTATATFGAPTRTYHLTGGYAVLVWSRPFVLLGRAGHWRVAPATAGARG